MKKLSRLTALLLVLLLFATAAAEGAIPLDEFTSVEYARLLAEAQDLSAAVGKKALTNRPNVAVMEGPSLLSSVVTTIANKGTEVLITFYSSLPIYSVWYGVSFEVDGQTITGYIPTDYLDVQEPQPEISYAPWDGVSESAELKYEVNGAASYKWERGLIGENGEITWEEVSSANSGTLQVNTTVDDLKYVYRCTALDATGAAIATSDEVTLVRRELAQWMATSETPVTEEMLLRAMKATANGLEGMVLEGNQLIYVRTGEVFATMDENFILTDKALNLPFGKVDFENKTILPIQSAQSADEVAVQ